MHVIPSNHNILLVVYCTVYAVYIYTLPETNIAPEKLPSQKESSLPTIHFQGAMLVFGSVHIYIYAPH